MSIGGWIQHLVGEGRLHLIEAVFKSDDTARTLLVSPEIWGLIEGPWPSGAWRTRCFRLRADLESFASGGEISICVEPFRARDEDLALLAKPEHGVWDYRSREPRPGLRLLGQFVGRDTFVALIPATRSIRDEFIPRGPLGDKDSREWRRAIRDCRSQFRSLFSPYKPITGGNLSDLLSGGYHTFGDG